jgi:ABC-type branched-subunit amino acid transport system substrate-binding protein
MSCASLLMLLLALATPAAFEAEAVRIGVLEGGQFAQGAAEAAADLNAGAGMAGRRIELLQVTPESPWQDGAGLTARLVFEADVVALVGPADGTGSHIAAQIATRKRIPLLSVAPEDTLTQAHVPWVFRGVPGDAAQARAVLDLLFADSRGHSAALAVPAGREGRQRLASLRQVCGELGMRVHSVVEMERGALQDSASLSLLRAADVLLLWLDPEDALALLGRISADALPARMAGSTRLDDRRFWAQAPAQADDMVLPLLRRQAGSGKSTAHALGYDMVRALAAAAGSGGITAQRLQRALDAGMQLSGKSGVFRFDSNGNRLGRIPLARVRHGHPIPGAQPVADTENTSMKRGRR